MIAGPVSERPFFSHYHEAPGTPQKSVVDRIAYLAKALFWTLEMFIDPVVDFFTQGLSDCLALETLRHGTRLDHYISIRINGLDPKYGGGKGGATKGYAVVNESNSKIFTTNSLGKCHVSKDNLHPQNFYLNMLNRHVFSRLYVGVSSFTLVGTKPGALYATARAIVAILGVIFVPTVKVRFSSERLQVGKGSRFQEDENSLGMALTTAQKIGPENIGLRGVLNEGCKGDVWARMRANPRKVAWGAIKLINPIGILMLTMVGLYFLANGNSKARELDFEPGHWSDGMGNVHLGLLAEEGRGFYDPLT